MKTETDAQKFDRRRAFGDAVNVLGSRCLMGYRLQVSEANQRILLDAYDAAFNVWNTIRKARAERVR